MVDQSSIEGLASAQHIPTCCQQQTPTARGRRQRPSAVKLVRASIEDVEQAASALQLTEGDQCFDRNGQKCDRDWLPKTMPFDSKRMIFGGFKSIVEF